MPTTEAADSEAAIKAAQHPYGYCTDDDDMVTVNMILPATKDSPLFCAHALAETDIATTQAVMAVLSITHNGSLQEAIKAGYNNDNWCKKLRAAAPSILGIQERDGLLFIGE